MASQHSRNAEDYLRIIAQLSTADKKLEVIVQALNEIILAVKKLEDENPG